MTQVQLNDIVAMKMVSGDVVFGRYQGVQDTEAGLAVILENPHLLAVTEEKGQIRVGMLPYLKVVNTFPVFKDTTLPFNVNVIEVFPAIAEAKHQANFIGMTSKIMQPIKTAGLILEG